MLPESNHQKIRILLIYSDQTNINYFRLSFKNLGCQVSSTPNPENGFDIFKNYYNHNHPFDICLLDYQLKGTNGILLARRLRVIDPTVLLMLLPSPPLSENGIIKQIKNFSGFTQSPDITYQGLSNLVIMARKKRNG